MEPDPQPKRMFWVSMIVMFGLTIFSGIMVGYAERPGMRSSWTVALGLLAGLIGLSLVSLLNRPRSVWTNLRLLLLLGVWLASWFLSRVIGTP